MTPSSKPRRVTLQDIALRTGYTINTISHALKNKPDIAPATRKHIQQVAQEMGYIRNQMASSLRSGRTHTLGVIVGGMSNPYYGIMTEEVQNVAMSLGYSLLILCSRDNPELELNAVQAVISRQVDGILLFPCAGSEQSIALIRSAGIPFVLMGRPMDGMDEDCVCCDEELGAYLITQHLIEAGHKKIGFLSMFQVMYSTPQRTHGFLRACRDAGLAEGDYHIAIHERDDQVRQQLLSWHQEGVDGLFIFCDMEAWHMIVLMDGDHLTIPGDMDIAGFDNIQGSLPFACPLCTVDYDLPGMAKCGVELLRRRIKNEDLPYPQRITFHPKVVCRNSCHTQQKSSSIPLRA